MKWSKLISELKRRNVFKSSIAYLALAWIVIQIASVLFPAFETPDYVLKALIYLLAFGFVIWIPVSWVYEITPEGIQKTKDYKSSEADIKFADNTLNKFIVTSLAIAVLLLIVISFWAGSRWDDESLSETSKKIAVIPLVLPETNSSEAYFIDGMTELLIDELSKVDQLTIVNNASVKVLQAGIQSNEPYIVNVIRGIDYYVLGKIERQQNKINVLIEIKETLEAESIWKKNYRKDVSDIRSFWAEVAQDLTRQLSIKVKLEDSMLWDNLKKVNPETFELYLKGKHYINQSLPKKWEKGIVYLQEAIDKNPSDPYAYAHLAEAYINLGHGPSPPPEVFPKALAAAERAIQLDSTVAMGWAALSHYHTYFGMDWDMAEYAFERANELNPNLGNNHYHRAWFLTLFGQMNEAIAEHKKAQELDPFTFDNTAHLGLLFQMVGSYQEGLAESKKLAYMNDKYAWGLFVKGMVFIDQGRVDEGLNLLREVTEINPHLKYWGLGSELINNGYIEEGRAITAALEDLPLNGYTALCLGVLYAQLGEIDKAMEYFSYEHRHGWFPWLRVMFVKGEIREDPRFIKMIRDMDLPDQSPLIYHPEALGQINDIQ